MDEVYVCPECDGFYRYEDERQVYIEFEETEGCLTVAALCFRCERVQEH